MGLGSFLKKIALPAASIAAAPFTGGASLLANIGTAAKAVAPTLSRAAEGSAGQRVAEAPALQGAYTANLAGTKLGDQRAMLASLLGGVQDASIARPAGSTIPTFGITGGLRPSALAGKEGLMSRLQQPIKPLEMPTAGTMEKVLGYGGLAGNILSALPKFGGGTPPLVADRANPAAGVPEMPWTLPPLSPTTNAGGVYNPSQLPSLGGSNIVSPNPPNDYSWLADVFSGSKTVPPIKPRLPIMY